VANINKTMIGLQPETPIPLSTPKVSGIRLSPMLQPDTRGLSGSTPVYIPPARRGKRRPSQLSPLGAQLVAAAVVCYLLALLTAATVWL
jgi:hypothetical protein